MTEIETSLTEATTEYASCGECGAAVDPNQRYCVSCGAHRAKAADPGGALSGVKRASALARVRTAEAARAGLRRPTWRRYRGYRACWRSSLVLAAAGIGFAIGSSSAGTTVAGTTAARTSANTSTRAPGTKTKTTATGTNYVNQEKTTAGVVAEP